MPNTHLQRPAALLLACAIFSACGGESAVSPTEGAIQFNITTTGADLDADGISISVDGIPQAAPVNGMIKWSGAAGSHEFSVGDLAINCDMTSTATSAMVTLGETTAVDVQLACKPFLSNVVVFTNDGPASDVLVMRPDGTRRTFLTTDHAVYTAPTVSPDGQTIAVVSLEPSVGYGIFLLDRFGKTRTKVVTRSPSDYGPTWSPDGKTLAFRSTMHGANGDYGRIWLVGRDGSGLRQLTPDNVNYLYDDGPAWSPDGTKILFSRSGELYVINPDGSGLTDLGVSGRYPAWSPDGTRIAFEGYANNQQCIFIADANGRNARQLLTPMQADVWPRWSPDGQQLVFNRVEANLWQIYRVSVDGSGLTRISTTTLNETTPVWTRTY